MIASPHTRLSCGHEISTTAGLSEGVVFAKRKQGNNWLRRLSEDPPDTLPPTPPPAALRWTAELQMGLTLWLIKDLPGEFGIILLTFKAARWGGRCTKMPSIWGQPPNDFVGWTVWGGCQQRESTIICSKLQTHAEPLQLKHKRTPAKKRGRMPTHASHLYPRAHKSNKTHR